MSNNIKHVFFDLDHTLWDFDKNSGLAFEKIFGIHQIGIDLRTFLDAYEPINFKYWKLYREEKVTKTELRYGRLKNAFDQINVSVNDETINKLSEDYITYLTTFNHLFDGAINILNYLSVKYHLHIITNGFQEAQEKKISASNIKHHFNTITNSEMVGVKKPNPKIFNFALDAANALPQESIMIGDNIEADVQGALDVGMDAILFDYRKDQNTQDLKKITHLKELELYL